MKVKTFATLATLLIVVSAFALITGCSDSATDSTPKQIGSLTDPEFVASSEQLTNATLDFDAMDWGDLFFDSIPGFSPMIGSSRPDYLARRTSGPGDSVLSFTLTIDSVNFWFIFQATITNLSDTATVVDSLQFLGSNGPLFPTEMGDSITGFNIRVHAQIIANDTGSFTGSAASHAWITANVIGFGDSLTGGDTISFSGATADTLMGTASDTDGVCNFTVASSRTITNVLIIDDLAHPCPIDGDISASVNADIRCIFPGSADTLSINGGWTVAASFNADGSANVTYENATTRWTQVIPCDDAPQSSPLVRYSNRIRGN